MSGLSWPTLHKNAHTILLLSMESTELSVPMVGNKYQGGFWYK
jgi:hypothetical protein